MILQAPAKINFSLDITGKREDGYHEVKMIMETVSLYDTVKIFKGKGIKLRCSLPYVPVNEKNIAYKAAAAFFEEIGGGGAFIDIVKRIPVAAGLAGGSTDGAVVLKGLNLLYDKPFDDEKLKSIAVKIGADVPYCINGRLALAEGIGEKLTPLGPCPKMFVLLAKPNIALSTKLVYSMVNIDEIKIHPDTDFLVSALKSGDIKGFASKMYNVLENVSAGKFPIIEDIKKTMLKGGALGSMMSGSGPTVFGIFDDEQQAKKIMPELKKICGFVYLAHTL